MARKKAPDPPPPGAPAWMATFSDLMTQILCFFVFLTSMSTLDLEKSNIAVGSFQGTFGSMGSMTEIVFAPRTIAPTYMEPETKVPGVESAFTRDPDLRDMEWTRHDITAYVQAQKKERDVKLNLDIDKMTISLTNNLLFEGGSAELAEESKPLLYEIAIALRRFDNPILVEGHTDPSPVSSELYPSNWELSLSRAMAVANFLMKKGNVSESRLVVSGAAQYKPITPNITAEGRYQNRRVDLIVLMRKDAVYGGTAYRN